VVAEAGEGQINIFDDTKQLFSDNDTSVARINRNLSKEKF